METGDLRTREQLIDRALSESRVVGEGQPPSLEQRATVSDNVDPFFAYLRTARIYPSSNAELINLAEYVPFAILLADFVSGELGKPVPPGRVTWAKNTLRIMNKQPLNANNLVVDRALRQPSREPFDGR